jgi:hypothetical protein
VYVERDVVVGGQVGDPSALRPGIELALGRRAGRRRVRKDVEVFDGQPLGLHDRDERVHLAVDRRLPRGRCVSQVLGSRHSCPHLGVRLAPAERVNLPLPTGPPSNTATRN